MKVMKFYNPDKIAELAGSRKSQAGHELSKLMQREIR